MSDAYLREATKGLEIYIEQAAARLGSQCESPIEVGLLKGLIALHLLNRQFQIEGLPKLSAAVTDYEANIFIQHQAGEYRLDFAVHLTGASGGKQRAAWIAIECDGHEFHERTKEQAKRDKSRDRELTTRGFRMLRFTGSEIYASSFACAIEVHLLVRSIIDEWEGE